MKREHEKLRDSEQMSLSERKRFKDRHSENVCMCERDIYTDKRTVRVRHKEKLRERNTLQEIKADTKRKRECETERETL